MDLLGPIPGSNTPDLGRERCSGEACDCPLKTFWVLFIAYCVLAVSTSLGLMLGMIYTGVR
jgi:hypothetical protein